MRLGHPSRYIPCRVKPKDPKHRYQLHERSPIRLRCGLKGCHDHLPAGEMMRWFSKLILSGTVDKAAVGLKSLTLAVAEANRPQTYKIHNITHRVHPFKPPPYTQLERLNSKPVTYRTRWTDPDGNCMFKALAKAMGKDMEAHKELRLKAVDYIREHRQDFERFIEVGRDDPPGEDLAARTDRYLDKMAQNGTWGDHLTIQALCSAYKIGIAVLGKMADGNFTWMRTGSAADGKGYIALSLVDEHYENLFSMQEVFPNL
ncbi:uncharacterized protein I303_108117 [Kwoniella dejecticola CBS 10117]|uniref:OTU domain-containing protein n=2 Tax=Kwoniella dejecticola CBS 10117 TaxID=1296121 RepID=A0AAJ8KVC0_9TREE